MHFNYIQSVHPCNNTDATLNLCCCYLSYKRKKMIGNKKTEALQVLVRGGEKAPWNPNAHLTYNFSTF